MAPSHSLLLSVYLFRLSLMRTLITVNLKRLVPLSLMHAKVAGLLMGQQHLKHVHTRISEASIEFQEIYVYALGAFTKHNPPSLGPLFYTWFLNCPLTQHSHIKLYTS